jgi:N-acetylmuramoyl-L-alanine amidase
MGAAMMPALDDWGRSVLYRTVWGEARGGGPALWQATTWSIKNRVLRPKKYGASAQEACLRPSQYSCWHPGVPGTSSWQNWLSMVTAKDSDIVMIASIVDGAWNSNGPDPTGGATHYYVDGSPEPYWATVSVFTAKITNTLFFKGVP